jgi:hypothetical protein
MRGTGNVVEPKVVARGWFCGEICVEGHGGGTPKLI